MAQMHRLAQARNSSRPLLRLLCPSRALSRSQLASRAGSNVRANDCRLSDDPSVSFSTASAHRPLPATPGQDE